jgi:hypothetical protein
MNSVKLSESPFAVRRKCGCGGAACIQFFFVLAFRRFSIYIFPHPENLSSTDMTGTLGSGGLLGRKRAPQARCNTSTVS